MGRLFSGSAALIASTTTFLMTLGMMAGNGPAQAATSTAHPAPGFVVSGVGRVLAGTHTKGTVVFDARGREHVVVLTYPHNFGRASYHYEIRGVHGRLISKHNDTLPIAGPAMMSAFISANGRKLVTVFAGCHNIVTARTAIMSTHLRTPKVAIQSLERCEEEQEPPLLYGAVPLPGGQIAVLASAGIHWNAPGEEPFGVYRGKPGHKLTLAGPQPTFPANTSGWHLTKDVVTGRLVIVAQEPVLTDSSQRDLAVSTTDATGSWSAPRIVARLHTIGSLTDAVASNGHVVAVASYFSYYDAPQPGVQLLEGDADTGTWRPSTAPAFTTTDDQAMLAPRQGGAALGYVDCDANGCGVFTSVEANGVWSTPASVSKRLTPTPTLYTLAVDKHGTPVVGFARRR